jgi:hypothetical protein
VLADHPTGADAEKLHHALQRERQAHRETKRALIRLERELFGRVEVLEQRPAPAGPDLAAITSGLASIRADLRGELAALRGELSELAEIVHQFARS